MMRGLPIDEINHGSPALQNPRAILKMRRELVGEATRFADWFEPVSRRLTTSARVCPDAQSSIPAMGSPRRQKVLGIIHLRAGCYQPTAEGSTRRMAIDVTTAGAAE